MAMEGEMFENDVYDPEFEQYVRDCEEYNDFTFDSERTYVKNSRILFPVSEEELNTEQDDYEMILLGKIIIPKEKIKKSFKYNLSSQVKYFCNNIELYNSCNREACRYSHKYEDILKCQGKCGKIKIDNNYHHGTCNRRHSNESFSNFLIRKRIFFKLMSKSLVLEFFKRPEEEFISEILNIVKQLGYEKLEIKIVKKQKTIEEWFSERLKYNSD
nr:MAG: hypothetical protein DiTV3a_F18ORF2 [Diabrotica toursvirus 3a]